MEKKKLFISQPMSSLTEEEVLCARYNHMVALRNKYPDIDFEVIDNYHHFDAPENANGLWHLGRSIQQLGEADLITFTDYNESSKGCVVEKLIADLYGIKII